MKKSVVPILILLFAINPILAQKYQRIAYIDMEYILQNIPEYTKAQNSLDAKVKKWREDVAKQTRQVEVLKTDLVNEKAILTKDLIEEREEDITLKQEDLQRLQEQYFGPQGRMYTFRKQLVQPIQDQVYNAIQDIAKRKNYDFVFDKSSDLVMLYSNKKYDISTLVLKIINRDQKIKDKKTEQAEKLKQKHSPKEPTQAQKQKIAKQKALEVERISKREKRKKLLKQRREATLEAHKQKRLLQQKKRDSIKAIKLKKRRK